MEKVAAIVVTYNRLELLKKCIESIRNQTIVRSDIIVINNGSSDGTKEWIDDQTDIFAVHQDNVGGAGGFYAGMNVAFTKGYDWFWLMDDDGIAHHTQLSTLLDFALTNNIYFVNALVINIDDYSKLSFGFNHNGCNYKYVDQLSGYTSFPQINPFNGTLIHRNVLQNIGYVKKEMFIWGDEQEYTFRALANGFKIATVVKAIHYHPKNKGLKDNVIPFIDKYKVVIKPQNLAHIYYRNLGYIQNMYLDYNVIGSTIAKYTIYFLCRLKFKQLHKFIVYYIKGVKGIFE